jgi:uncharacterized protein (DUF4415 family)
MKPKPATKPFKSQRSRQQRVTDSPFDPLEAPVPALEPDFFRGAKLRLPEAKQPVSLRLDKDLVAWFKAEGRGYQTRINAILRLYAQEHGLKPGAP